MSGSAALAALTALLALSGCFQLSPKSCEVLCTATTNDCPGDLHCVIQDNMNYGICTAPGGYCPPLFADAGMPLPDAGSPDADAGAPLPPGMLCHNGACFTLPDAVRANLVLLLWPSNLPPVGSTVSVWKDQSGQGNDAHALIPAALPTVIADGIHLDATQPGTGFVVVDSPTLDFASGDFALVVVAGLSSSTTPLSLARKSDGARTNSRRISIDWILSAGDSAITGRPEGAIDDTLLPANSDIPHPAVADYTLYRSTDHVELHMNSTVLASADLPTPGLSTTNTDDLYVGVSGLAGAPADSIEAVIAVRGPIESAVLTQLELFLNDAFVRPSP
jgi:hypothetical protein